MPKTLISKIFQHKLIKEIETIEADLEIVDGGKVYQSVAPHGVRVVRVGVLVKDSLPVQHGDQYLGVVLRPVSVSLVVHDVRHVQASLSSCGSNQLNFYNLKYTVSK